MHLKRRLAANPAAPIAQSKKAAVPAILTALAVTTAAAFGGQQILNTQENGGGGISATSNTASFADGETIVIDDPAIATQGEGESRRAVKQFQRDEQFSQFALTWSGEKDIAAFVRAQKEDGSWGEWFAAEPMDVPGAGGKHGTELIYVEPTNAVQVSISGVELVTNDAPTNGEADKAGEAAPEQPATDAPAQQPEQPAAEQPATQPEQPQQPATKQKAEKPAGVAPLNTNYGDIQPVAEVAEKGKENGQENSQAQASELEAVFIDGGTDSGIDLMAESAAQGMPNVVTRAGWGANEGARCKSPTYNDRVKAMTLHHTAGSNNYSPAQAAAQMRGIYKYHAQTLGWCDIGYNVLVDKYGTIYEGRYGGLDKAVEGAHAGGFNTNTWGISMIGDYENSQPPQVMLDSVAKIAGWKAAKSGFDPMGKSTHYSKGSDYTRYSYGTPVTLNNFFGHNDVGNTSCPGRYVINQWPAIRSATKRYYDTIVAGGTVTAPKPNPGAPAPAPNPGGSGQVGAGLAKMSSLAGSSEVSGEEIGAVLTLAGTVVGLLVATGAADNFFAGAGSKEIASGITVQDAVGIADSLMGISGDADLQNDWDAIKNTVGPVLGEAQGGPTVINEDLAFQMFNKGLLVDSSSTGPVALIAPIAKAWAEAGLNAGDLGLPTSDMHAVDANGAPAVDAAGVQAQATDAVNTAKGKKIRVDFQGGYIDYDPNTQKVDVFTK